METHRVFTISSGAVTEGATIRSLHLKGAGIEISAVVVGEEGYGREQGVVPVDNPPMVSSDTGMVWGRLLFAEVGKTRAGKPKFLSRDKATSDDKIIAVFETKIGFRGSNNHTGDRVGWECECGVVGNEIVPPEACPNPECKVRWFNPKLRFTEFPGEIIARGRIAEGMAGREASGEQLIALIPKDVVFRTSYSGRLYGAPNAHYYKWNGLKLISVTWDERVVADLF